MDDLTRRMAAYAASARFEDCSQSAIEMANRLLVDGLACGVAAYDCETARIGRILARGTVPERYAGRILGFGERSTSEAAAFVNTCMIRALDFNDHYPSGHPSDCLGGLLALAEAAGADGRRLISAMVVAYELFIRLNDPIDIRRIGWDQGFIIGLSTAAGIGNMLGLSAEAIGQALAITAVANVPMRNTRAGELSLWKGAATAYAVRNGIFGALLAAEGMTGPDRPFEGRHGLWDLITGPFELAALPNEGAGYRITDVDMKYWPVEYNAQVAVWAALEIRGQIDWRDIAELRVGTYAFAVSEIGGEPEKWDPQTRETADHSMPYIIARTLVDGTIGAKSFEHAAFSDAALRPLMAKIQVGVDPAVDAAYPPTVAITAAVTTTDGGHHAFELRDPLGHASNPMQDKDVRAKFLASAEPVLGPQRAAAALERWSGLPELTDLSDALNLLDLPPAAR